MFGRDRERGQLEQVLDAGAAGPCGTALEGTPGIGKTTLWRAAVESARRRGYTILATTPSEPDAALAFAGLGDLFDQLDEHIIETLPEPQRQALTAALLLGGAADAPRDLQALPRAVLSVVRQLARSGALLVAIDDEQWLDRPSARALAFALCRLRDEPVCVLLARRPQSDGALWPELSRGFGDGGIQPLVLRALDEGAIRRLLTAHTTRAISAPLLRRIYAASGGNPLYALAIARELDASDTHRTGEHELRIPRTLADAVAQRLERLDARAADPLLVVAALSTPKLALIHSVLPEFALSDLDSAEAAEIVEISGDSVRFTHPLLASTHYAASPAGRRRELHRLLSEFVSDDVERAHHLALGAEAPDRTIAVTLEHAADEASCRGAPETAAELLEQACRLTPADAVEALRSRRVSVAELHAASGNLLRARAGLEALLADLPSGPIRARALLALAMVRTDDFAASTGLCEDALKEAGVHLRVAARAHAHLAELWSNRGDVATAVEHATAALSLADEAGDVSIRPEMLALQGLAAFFSGAGIQRELMDEAIELEHHAERTASYYMPSTSYGNQLFWSDELDAARPLLERSLRRAVERGEEFDRAGILFHLAHLEWEAGRVDVAQRHTDEVEQAVAQLEDDQGTSYVLWLRAFLALRHGELDRARSAADEAIAVAGRIGDQFIVAFSTEIQAAAELWSGDPDAAHRRLPPLRDALVPGGAGFVGSLTLGTWFYDIEALVALGRLAGAEHVLTELSARARGAQNPNAIAIAHRCRGLILAARGDVAAAIDAMDAALSEHARRPLPLEVGRTLLEKGTLERRLKRKSAAKRSLEAALETLDPLGAAMWADRARDELARVGLRRARVSEGLTPAQTRVAELVASGMSNREIASTLYMSQRTVETHLTKVYRELGVKSRSQLAATLSVAAQPSRGHQIGDDSAQP